MNPNTNLEVKTEVDKPFLFAGLKTYRDYLIDNNLKECSEILTTFMKNAFTLLISKKRKSREEIIRAIASTNNTIELNENIDNHSKGLIQR